jgi:broad specificity phosphatase PhoE
VLQAEGSPDTIRDMTAIQTSTKLKSASLGPYRTATGLTLVLVRHGEKGGPEVDGLVGPSLTALGRRQAKRLAHRLSNERFDHIYSSDAARSYQTCEYVRAYHEGTPYTMLADLREVAGFHQRGHEPARTREHRERRARERAAVDRFVRLLREQHLKPGQAVLVIGHGNLTRLIVPTLAGLSARYNVPVAMNNTAVTVVMVELDGRVLMRLGNCTRHLPSRMVN